MDQSGKSAGIKSDFGQLKNVLQVYHPKDYNDISPNKNKTPKYNKFP